jgi:hypothetical protein
MKTYEIMVEEQNNVSGNRKHGAIYPMFTTMPRIEKIGDGENINVTVIDKITIEDGQFSSSGRFGYLGQHCNLDAKIENGMIVTRSPYITGMLFSRNKYGATKREFRLNLETRCLEHPMTRNGVKKWYKFSPSNYID